MDSQFSDIRKEYKKGKLTRNTISENPFEQFARWLNDALHCGENEPTAMIVATVSPDGRPSTRTVLLKGVENGKLIFFTNYESRKGRQLTANPYISLSFVWHKLERQVHIEGKAEKCTPQESDAYFSTRPYKSRIGARISPPKSRHQQPDGNNPRFCKGSCQADRTDRTTSRQLGRFCRHPHPLRILAGTGKQAARPFRIYSPRRKVRFRPIVSKLRKMGDKPPCTLNRTVKVLYPMNKA